MAERRLREEKEIVDFSVLFLRRARSPDRPPLDSHPLPTDYETRALTNAPPGTVNGTLEIRVSFIYF